MSGDNIKVIARFRPTNTRETEEMAGKEGKLKLTFPSNDTAEVAMPPNQYRFTFDRVYPPDTKQVEFYEGVARNTVNDVLDGFNGTIFAYGQTGAGKSYTMMGPDGSIMDDDMRGVIPRAAGQLFDAIRGDKGEVSEWKIKCSYLEIYLETVTDLFRPELSNLKVRETPSQGVWVDGLTEEFATCEQDIFDL
eukprot:m51a1_g12276 putative kinesin heavy chain (192) ;mRNA; f:226847-227593